MSCASSIRSCARFATSIRLPTTGPGSRRNRLHPEGIELTPELARVLGRGLADEVFAEIGRRRFAERAPVGQQRDRLRAGADGEQAIGEEALADDLEQAISLRTPDGA